MINHLMTALGLQMMLMMSVALKVSVLLEVEVLVGKHFFVQELKHFCIILNIKYKKI